MNDIKVRWRKLSKSKQGRKIIDVSFAIAKGHKDRFVLYPNHKVVDTMWILHDFKKDVTHFLCAIDWPDAKIVARKRIIKVLNNE